jgi:predicted enzyme related to lactoylglutathione lyase
VNLNGILIGTEDPGRLTAYYSEVLGKPGFEGWGYTSWQIGSGSLTIGPHDQVKGRNQEPGRIIWNIETPNVKQEFERLKANGATVVREPYQPGDAEDTEMEAWIATFSDPDENYFQLVSPMPENPS